MNGIRQMAALERDASGAARSAAVDDETSEWRDALRSLIEHGGAARARQILDMLAAMAREPAIGWRPEPGTPYLNSIPAEQQPAFPGDLALEERLASIMRWNALAMVVRANKAYGELGGHIASYASAAELFEVGFNHFFRACLSRGLGEVVCRSMGE
jgi:pyruvate dehydrogenase E1 component